MTERTGGELPPVRLTAADRRHSVPPVVSVVVVAGGRNDLLARCVASLRQQREAPAWELILCADSTVARGQRVDGMFRTGDVTLVPGRTPAGLRNQVLHRARGELLLFLDDDATLPPDYLARLAELAGSHPEAGVFGGPNVTPFGSSRFEVTQGAVLSSLVGAGPVRRRYGPHPATEADERYFTLCNLAVRREVMTRFDDDLVCAEENELLGRLRASGVRMRYDPQLSSGHHRRPDRRGFAAQMWKYGRGRGQLAVRSPRTLRPAHLAPSLAVAYLAAAIVGGAFEPLLLLPVAGYLAALLGQAAWISRTLARPGAAPEAFGLLLVLHVCYGCGLFAGLAEPRRGPARGAGLAVFRLLWVLVVRQLRLRSKRAFIGIVWPVLAPLVLLALYVFVFRTVFHIPIRNYPVFLFAGLLPWTFLAQSLGAAVISLSTEPELIRRARFPYVLLPMASVTATFMYFVATVTGFVVYLAARGELVWSVLPGLLLPLTALYVFVGALSTALGLIDVYNRDLRQVLGNLLTIWFFLVPIVYTQRALTSRLLVFRSVDPVNLIVGEFRDVLYYGQLSRPAHDIELIGICFGFALIVLRVGAGLSDRLPKDV